MWGRAWIRASRSGEIDAEKWRDQESGLRVCSGATAVEMEMEFEFEFLQLHLAKLSGKLHFNSSTQQHVKRSSSPALR
jgi:hypothetical protein